MLGWNALGALILTACLKLYPLLDLVRERPVVSAGTAGTIIGRRVVVKLGEEKIHQETYLGIPYALPPVGDLRFRPPLSVPPDPNRIIDASDYGYACMQGVEHPGADWPIRRDEISEDCLHLNLIRPVINTSEALPVMVWIYGGALEEGYTKWYDGRHVVAQSVAIEQPVVFVSMDYRLHAFGFLASQDVLERSRTRKDVGLNLGYLDQRLALEWVQQYISYFGGDPKKVTIYGESAGAFAVGAHLAAEANKSRGLFRGAIMQSGSIAGAPVMLPGRYQASYEHLLSRLSCGPTDSYAAQFEGDAIACLRSLPAAKINDVARFIVDEGAVPGVLLPWFPVQDGDFHARFPSETVRMGHFAKVPALIGTDLDEGTPMSPPNLVSEHVMRQRIMKTKVFYPDSDSNVTSRAIDKLLQHYPDVPREGAPFINPSNGSSLSFDPDSRIFEPLESNQFKRYAAIHGDGLFESGRRLFLDAHSEAIAEGGRDSQAEMHMASAMKVPVWSYQYRQPDKDAAGHLGVYHGSDLPAIFARHAEENSEDGEVSRAMSRMFIRFANSLDPNGPEIPTWPPYEPTARSILQIRAGNFSIIPDDWRIDAIQFQLSPEWARLTGR